MGGCGREREVVARRMGMSCMSIAIPPADATTNAHSPSKKKRRKKIKGEEEKEEQKKKKKERKKD